MPASTECPRPEALRGLARGQLPQAEAAALWAHVAVCSHCQQALSQVRLEGDTLTTEGRPPQPAFSTGPDARSRVRGRRDRSATLATAMINLTRTRGQSKSAKYACAHGGHA